MVVVDPGVGSARRALAARAGGCWFVGPDNGVLTAVLTRRRRAIVEIASPRYMRAAVSRTFEGRDRFAPAAAWLLRGVPLDALGPPVTDPVRLDLPRPRVVDGILRGVLIAADRFGNVATSIDRAAFEAFAGGAPVRLTLAGRSGAAGRHLRRDRRRGSGGALRQRRLCSRSRRARRRRSAATGVQPGAPIEVARQPDRL